MSALPTMSPAAEGNRFVDEQDAPLELKHVSWIRQFKFMQRKSMLLMSRRPILMAMMLFSSIVSVVFGWLLGRPSKNAIYGPVDQCGIITSLERDSDGFEDDDQQITRNDRFRSGFVVALMALGPMLNAICAFLLVHDEFANQLIGVLRGLGLRDSAFWSSWYAAIMMVNVINAALGTITVKSLPLHSFENIYAGGIFASFLFLHFALVPTSFFFAAFMRHMKRGVTWIVLLILVAIWVTPILVSIQSSWPWWAYSANEVTERPGGFFWLNQMTMSLPWQSGEGCNTPLVSESQGDFFKTDEQRAAMTDDEFFVGCFFAPSWHTKAWNPQDAREGILLATQFMFPYFHFMGMWTNYVGYTSMPGNQFKAEHFAKSSEELAVASLPAPPNPDNALTSSLAPQGSTFLIGYATEPYDPDCIFSGNCQSLSNCPMPDRQGADFCGYLGTCHHVIESSKDSPSAATYMIYLIINAFIYMMLACYWAQVFPGMNGKPQKPYFFLLPSYWLGNKAEVEPIESDDGEAQTNSQVGRNTIVVNDVRKTYGAFEALKGISMTMKRGEVTAFLGHNGAGKTTLSHIISCDTAATQGDVNVFGVSVNNDPYSIRCMVGLCKQDDYLWANLTAREHLELFAGLRGVSDDDMGATVQKWLESVDLADVQLQYSSSFSGGMKRRLSVALATIGERPLIILDEPTTGMDPVSRRFVWRHIDEIKENRVVILTTHAMEEADLLAEEVAIMRRGDLAAFGSPLELKTQYGSALQFTLLVEREDVPSTQRFLNDFFAGTREHVKIDAPSTGNIIVNIQKVKVDRSDNAHEDIDQGIEVSDTGVTVEQLSTFMEWLSADSSKVQEYGFSNSSLEEVFLKVTGEAALSNDVSVDANGGGGGTTTNNTADPAVDRLEAAAAGQSNPERLNEIARFKPSLTVFNQVRALIGFYIHRNWVGRSSMSNYIIYSIMFGISVLVGLGTNFGDGRGYLVLPILFVSLMLVGIIGTIYSDRAENLFYLMRTQGLLPKSFLLGTTSYAFLVQFLFTFLTLTVLYFTPMFAKQQVCTETSTDYCDADFAQKPQISWSSMTFVDYQDTVGNEQVEIRAYRERGGYGLVFLLILCFTLSIPGSVLSSSFLPGYKIPLVAISFICVMASLVPLILFALAWVNSLRQEVSCTNDFQEYSDKPKITIEDSSGFCNDSYNQDNLDEYFVNCVGLDINSIYQFCIEPSASLLPQVGLFQGLSMVYSNKITFVSDPPEYARDVLIPNISGVSCSGTTCNFPYASRLYWQSVWIMCLGSLCLTVIGVFATMTLGFPNTAVLRVRMYIVHFFEKLRCKSSGSSAGSSSAAEEGANKVFPEVREESRIVHEAIKSFTTVVGVAGEVEEGTVAETLQLDHNSIPRDAVDPVITHKLSKTYPALGGRPPKRALEDLDLHVPKGQCLGFLGKNGAGKTTALKILAGGHDPSSGFGLVGGYDSALERIPVFERLGNCPQFDVVWRNQSVGAHLEFFARLKGLPGKQVQNVSRAIAEAVGLGSAEVYGRDAGALSGGMRRRLSIAMSLIGSPSVLILDEPTTGLDPSTRNNIWALINSFNSQERSTIITTHMMIEADTLCNRIAIIANGKLKVIESQQHLKDQYGSGYLLQLNLIKSSPETQESAMAFVRKHLHEGADLATKQAKTLHVNLPRDLDLTRVFRALYSPESATEGCINQFLLSQSSLEDVFIALGD